MDKLRSGDQFPSLKLKMLDGSTWMLPDDFRAEYNIVLIYRGHW